MTDKPLIAAFDIASVTGVCLGRVGDPKPITGVIDLRSAGTARPRRMLYFANQLAKLFAKYKPDIVRYEAPLNIGVMMRVGSGDDVVAFLRGAIGVLEAEAARCCDDVGTFDMHAARQSLTGFRTFPKSKGKSTAKEHVMAAVRLMGIEVIDHNSADATCGWLYCCALTNPRIAAQLTPLFRGEQTRSSVARAGRS